MRILSVRFANINSLKGDFEIDFTSPELAGRGIFAITGRTGSGKTSILDAITLALFGRTPRLPSLASENELMSRGTGFCSSEVTFETVVDSRSLQFRSRWEQRRARGNADGKLQPAHMHLVQLTDKRPTDAWETSKLSEVSRKVEEITGLDYERFTRTCLLAQGQFAAFLDASPGKRAEILEQITGTDIYRDISIAAYERHAAVEGKITELRNRLEGITLLGDEEFESLRQAVARLRQDWEACEGRRQGVQKQIAWVRNLQALVSSRIELVARRKGLAEERETHAAEFLRLEMSRKAEPARLPLAQRDGLIQNRGKRETELNAVVAGIPTARRECETAFEERERAGAEKAGFQSSANAELETLKSVRALDQKLRSQKETSANLADRLDDLGKKRAEAEVQVLVLRETIATSEEKKKHLEDELAKTSIDASLAGDLKLLESIAARHAEIEKDLDATGRELDTCRKNLDLARQDVENAGKAIEKAGQEVAEKAAEFLKQEETVSRNHHGATVQTLQAAAREAEKSRVCAEEAQTLAGEFRESAAEEARFIESLEKRKAEIEKAITFLGVLEEKAAGFEAEIEELNEQKIRLKTMASFEDQRHLLEDGKPCPLCGALAHPFAAGVDETSRVKEIEARLKKAKAGQKRNAESLRNARDLHQSLAAEQAADERSAADLRKAAASWQNKWKKVSDQFGGQITPENEARLAELVEAAGAALKRAETASETYLAAMEAREKASKELTASREKLQDLDKRRAAFVGILQRRETLVETTDRKRLELETRLGETEESLRKYIIIYGYPEFDDTVLPRLRERWEARQESQKAMERTLEAWNDAQTKLTGAVARLDGLSQQVSAVEGEAKLAIEALEAISAERRALYQDRDPDVEERKLRETAAGHQAREEAAGKRYQELLVVLEQQITTEKHLRAGLDALAAELAESQLALDAARAAGGFVDEEALRAALLPGDEAARLDELEKRFITETAQILGSLEGIDRQIAEQEAARPTDLSLESLLERERQESDQTARAMAAWQERSNALAMQEQSREQHRDIAARIQDIRREGNRWTKLSALIGSANGDKFQKFAQGLTFSNLVYQANRQLQNLSDRYLLTNDDLELRVIDNFIGGAKATAKNLSGGEKFLASLALALGLAHMVGRKYRMDTLFIDEGFGALDPETLETALSVLCTLHQQGKLIGVISHVESLQERLPARLEVARTGGGHSTITGPGCIHHGN